MCTIRAWWTELALTTRVSQWRLVVSRVLAEAYAVRDHENVLLHMRFHVTSLDPFLADVTPSLATPAALKERIPMMLTIADVEVLDGHTILPMSLFSK
jgi:hypothetical protein